MSPTLLTRSIFVNGERKTFAVTVPEGESGCYLLGTSENPCYVHAVHLVKDKGHRISRPRPFPTKCPDGCATYIGAGNTGSVEIINHVRFQRIEAQWTPQKTKAHR